MGPGPRTPWNDPVSLREQQYRTDTNLAARQSIYAFRQPPQDLMSDVLDQLALAGDETVLDVGCGNGLYLAELERRAHRGRVVGLDLSAGMLARARSRTATAALAVADAMRLPAADAVVDVTLALHMLYHVPDPEHAVRELRRVTRPGGRVAVVLNGADHLRELREVVGRASQTLGGQDLAHERVTLDDGLALLAAAFPTVRRVDFAGVLAIPDAGPVCAYAHSMVGIRDLGDLSRLDEEISALLPTDGTFHVTTHGGVLVADRP